MEILEIVLLSLLVSGTAGVLSFSLALVLGIYLFKKEKRYTLRIRDIFRALTGVPTVIFGLIALLLLSRKGVLGGLGLLFTPTAIIIAQFIFLFPLGFTLISDLLYSEGEEVLTLCKVLQIPENMRGRVFFRELKKDLLGIFMLLFSRGISEVGAVMVVGGNIKGYTRVMTTYIALSTNMGQYRNSIGIGIVLFTISYSINLFLRRVGRV